MTVRQIQSREWKKNPASLLKRETRFTRRRKGGAGVPPAVSGDTPDTTLNFGLSFVKDFFSRCGARSTWLALCRGQPFADYLSSLPSAASGDFTRARKIIAAMTNGLKLASR